MIGKDWKCAYRQASRGKVRTDAGGTGTDWNALKIHAKRVLSWDNTAMGENSRIFLVFCPT